ncbi:hypothetical protein GLOTRDRAFT_122366 [Gloeophyllum trabeum ATCC 11539]|uniref:PIN domain-containing protein n=1 Tax=Gloeophyllum trabeum (strain ATCC 11539 / FP-39264 / Madison 617) TaxID=670483 RepID=S7PZH7_GLOTA|nr:uncharacterized protein GLOTRDRAFT_122366 [Gloeophyllum trabeum ATCC 11539]EPQ53066.1 hypothetical protein GLOTRDRAFT_122366 [Gloeophyllum trabeum ATCC 11539]
MNNNKLAMSRALGAAFLNHQVEQLEKTAANSHNWRDRKHPQAHVNRSVTPTGRSGGGGKRPPSASKPTKRRGGGSGERDGVKEDVKNEKVEEAGNVKAKFKDADVVVVDASVLIHCIGQVKKWCRDDREEIIIVPLEALNTLDLLKKGTSPLAQRARAASRILEAQVGMNPRIRVQRDDAFVPWDSIPFTSDSDPDQTKDKDEKAVSPSPPALGSPEWLRRTICCARWEAENGQKTMGWAANKSSEPKVVLAVVASANAPLAVPNPLAGSTTISPVPLPAPQVLANKHEPRSAGSVVAYWARKAGIMVMEVKPGAADREEDDISRKRNPTPTHGHHHGGGGGRVRRSSNPPERGGGERGGGLVERPPAVMAMMEMVGQPGKGPGKVVRVLARGEKLEPDTP